ncbi:MAG: hypothetical protein AAF747_04690 [Planctomycetota bacterium]
MKYLGVACALAAMSGCAISESDRARQSAYWAGRPARWVSASVMTTEATPDAHKLWLDALDADASDAARARDRFVTVSMARIDAEYHRFVDWFSSSRKVASSAADITSVGLATAATLAPPPGTKSLLAALSGNITAARASVREQFFYEQTVPVLVDHMALQRAHARERLLAGAGKPIDEYPLARAMADLDDYYAAGSFDGALRAIRRSAVPDR